MPKDKFPAPQVCYVTIDSRHAGQRIDNFLLTTLKGVPRSLVYRILRSGEVRVNKGRIKPAYRLAEGDNVRLPPVRQAQDKPATSASPSQIGRIESAVLLEDKNLLVLNKPSGMAVHSGSGIQFGVIELLRQSRGADQYLELAHRLDRDTSGCLIVAKNRTALLDLNDQLKEGDVQKRYVALLCGQWHGSERHVNQPLQRRSRQTDSGKVHVSESGKSASTRIRPRQQFKQGFLADIDLYTGRMHQIRVHTAHIGHPVAGDSKYGDFKLNAEFKKQGLQRLFLHAERLRFQLRDSSSRYEVKAPMDELLSSFLNSLEAG